MKFYTVQHEDVWHKLKNKGVYYTEDNFICDESFSSSYKWLNDQAKRKIKKWDTDRPVWLWLKKPDLRSYRFNKDPDKPKVQNCVLIELEIPAEQVLISEFGLWHCVLNNCYMAYSDKEDLFIEKRFIKMTKAQTKKAIQDSWKRCIVEADLKLSEKFDPSYIEPVSFQAIVSCLKLDQVISYKKFKMINTY